MEEGRELGDFHERNRAGLVFKDQEHFHRLRRGGGNVKFQLS